MIPNLLVIVIACSCFALVGGISRTRIYQDERQPLDSTNTNALLHQRNCGVDENERYESQLGRRALSTCVNNEIELRSAVGAAATSSQLISQQINLCSPRITISNQTTTNYDTGIDLSYLRLIFKCSLPRRQCCIIDGNGLSRLFYGTKATIIFSQIEFFHGSTVGSNTTNGGALHFQNSSIVFKNAAFSSNFAKSLGGAMYASYSNVTLTGGSFLLPTAISNNSALDRGGGIYLKTSHLSASNGTFIVNSNYAASGSALYFSDTTAQLNGITFSDNIALTSHTTLFGGSRLSMQNVLYSRNRSTKGCALGLTLRSIAALKGVVFAQNHGAKLGAGIYVRGSTLNLISCKFINNTISVVSKGGADLYVSSAGVSTKSNVYCSQIRPSMFCNGKGPGSIRLDSFLARTNCNTLGMTGTPGIGPCAV